VERAIQTKRPVVASIGLTDEPSESAVLSGARSALCAPISVRGEVVAGLYVAHRQVDGLFGADEERLAEFIATLAGAALENVEGVAKAEGDVIAGSTAALAHAIKNPLAVLRAYLGLIRGASDRTGGGVVDQYLHTMEGALERIGELVARLQSVQAASSGRSAVSVKRLIDEAVAEVAPLFPGKAGYWIDCEIAADAPLVIMAHEERLRLMIVNLLVNAHQAMPRGGRVGIAVRSEGGSTVEILIADQGPGISPSIEPRLFEPFVTTKENGTGLGLWVCKKIVEDHHQGRIEVCSVSGEGTTVRVRLPVRSAERAPAR
jgi:signal transduction histidine kinase